MTEILTDRFMDIASTPCVRVIPGTTINLVYVPNMLDLVGVLCHSFVGVHWHGFLADNRYV